MALPYDLHVVAQALLFFITVIFGFIAAVPLGLTLVEFDFKCILYTNVDWVNATYANYELSSQHLCNVPILTTVFTSILYALLVGMYFSYAAFKSNDPNVGYQMWVMPFLLANALVLIVMFIVCCMVSVGIKSTCDALLKGPSKVLNKCADFQTSLFNWNKGRKTDYNPAHFYTYSKVAGWILFLLWVAQMALSVLRFLRNRKKRSEGMGYDTMVDTPRSDSFMQPSDLENFAAVNPSA